MRTTVKVSGIPANVPINKLTLLFSHILSMRNSEFSMRLQPPRGGVKDILLSLPTYSEAELAKEKLDNFIYKHNNVTYMFSAELSSAFTNNKKSKPKYRLPNDNRNLYGQSNPHVKGYSQNRSCCPHYEEKSSHLDMQLEILRKQRMILEEERKLLEEQKKLDELKMKAINNETFNIEISGSSSNPPEKKLEPKQVHYHQASEVLLKKMSVFVYKHSSFEEHKALLMHLRSMLKERLAAVVAADGQGVYKTHKVILLYRSQYPISDDEEFVKEALKDIRKSCSTDDSPMAKVSGQGANAKNKSDVTMSIAGDNTVVGGNVAKDTTLSGELNDSERVSDTTSPVKFEEKRLFFHNASGVLIKKMINHVNKHALPIMRKQLVAYLRFIIKKQLAAVVAGQPIFQTHKIIKLYRSHHPATDDEDLVKQSLKDIVEDSESYKTFQCSRFKANNVLKQDHNTETLTGGNGSDECGQPVKNSEGIENTDKAEIVEKNHINIGEEPLQHLTKKNDEKDNGEFNIVNSCDATSVVSVIDLVSDNTDNIQSNIANPIADIEIKDVEATQDSPNYFVNTEINAEEESHGVKRKNDDIEDSRTKVTKTDNVVDIGSEEVQFGE